MANKNALPHGALVPIVTPFCRNGAINTPRFSGHLRWLIRTGADGIVVGGTTGEGHTLRREQKFRLIDVAVEEREERLRRSKLQLIAATGSQEFKEAETVSAYAKRKGCDAVLVLPPRTDSQRRIEDFYTALSKSVPGIVILAYNIPWLSHVGLNPDMVGRLVEKGCIAGVKDSSQKKGMLRRWKETNPDVLVAVGSDRLIYYGVHVAHAEAVIVGIGNVLPSVVASMYRTGGQTALRSQEAVNRISHRLSSGGDYVGALKRFMFGTNGSSWSI